VTEGVSWYALVKLLHVLSAIWLLTGLLARPVVLAAARRAPDMRILKAIADVSGRLEEMMIAPGLGLVLVTGIATAIVGGVPLFGPFVGGPMWLFVSLLIMIVAVLLTPVTLGHDRRWGQALEEAAKAGVVTERLRPFLMRDALIRRYARDIVSVLVIVALMVTKPF
jgi:uncharacterized membrane protein